jgi:hypothetical protein
MNRQLPLTPTEAEKFKALAVGESMWIVRAAVHPDRRSANIGDAFDEVLQRRLSGPPVEFVQACAPCETCGDQRIAVSGGPGYFKGGKLRHLAGGQTVMEIRCTACRIELVAICDSCDGQSGSMYGGSWGGCEPCNASGIIHLGWGYPIGQPLPILPFSTDHDDMPHICVDERPDSWLLLYPGSIEPLCGDNLTDALAHYGDPAGLVGKWALQVQVTP